MDPECGQGMLDNLTSSEEYLDAFVRRKQNVLHGDTRPLSMERRMVVLIEVLETGPDAKEWSLHINGHVTENGQPAAQCGPEERFSNFVEKVRVNLDPKLYPKDKSGIEFLPDKRKPLDGITITRPRKGNGKAFKAQIEFHHKAPTGNFQLYHVNSEYQSIVSKNLATLQEIREGVWDYAQKKKLRGKGSTIITSDELLKKMFNGEETLEGASLTEMIQEALKPAEPQTTVLLCPMQGPASDSEELCFVLDIPEAHGPALNMRIDDEDTSEVDGKSDGIADKMEVHRVKTDFAQRFTEAPSALLDQTLHSQRRDARMLKNPNPKLASGTDKQSRGTVLNDWTADAGHAYLQQTKRRRTESIVPDATG